MDTLNEFVKGALAMGYAVVAPFFLRFYWRTSDRLFAMFSGSFLLLGAIRVAMIVWKDPMEHQFLYWLRFIAFLLILIAIADKNLPRQRRLEQSVPDTLSR